MRAYAPLVHSSLQNVLLQIGLRVLGVDGKLIRQMRTYVLRCHACFKYVGGGRAG